MSSKMPKSARAQTRSALRLVVFSLLLIAALSIAWLVIGPEEIRQEPAKSAAACLKLERECFDLEVSDSDTERLKGLSGRDSLPDNQGMLFMFDRPEEQCFWMKDMKFSLDMIWTDEQKRIVRLEKNVSPDTYPASFCAQDTKYVLEFNRGFAAKYGLKPGMTLQF